MAARAGAKYPTCACGRTSFWGRQCWSEFSHSLRPLWPLDAGPDDLPRRLAFLSRLDEAIRSEYLPRAARALCNGKTSAFQAEDAGSIPAARSKNHFPTVGRQSLRSERHKPLH